MSYLCITMEYKIFRLSKEGFLIDISFKGYRSYIEAEKVIKGLQKTTKLKYTILTIYK